MLLRVLFLSFRAVARNPVWMLRCAQYDKTEMSSRAMAFVTSDSKLYIAEIERVMQRLILL